MIRKWLAVGIILLFVGTCIIPAIAQNIEPLPISRGNWLYVGGSGAGNYTKIQDAIIASSDGDTIFVFNGTYHEHIVIDKAINLLGEDVNTTTINDDVSNSHAIIIQQNHVLITGFTLFGEGIHYSIYSYQSRYNITIEGNNIIGRYGLYLQSTHNIIRNNFISVHVGGSCGIETTRAFTTIEQNRIFAPVGTGISVDDGSNIINANLIVAPNPSQIEGVHNVISNNTFQNSGLWFTHPSDNILTNNTVNGKPLVYFDRKSDRVIDYDAGQVILVGCDNVTITNQNISDSPVGIQVFESTRCSISNNTISSAGIVFYNSDTIKVLNNTIHSSTIAIGKYRFDEEYTTNNIIISRNTITSDVPGGNRIYIVSVDNLIFSYNHVVNTSLELHYFCHNCVFCCNNFMVSKFIDVEVPIFSYNKFRYNYWGELRLFPKFIFGYVFVPEQIPSNYLYWFFIDWHPAQEPYDIPGAR